MNFRHSQSVVLLAVVLGAMSLSSEKRAKSAPDRNAPFASTVKCEDPAFDGNVNRANCTLPFGGSTLLHKNGAGQSDHDYPILSADGPQIIFSERPPNVEASAKCVAGATGIVLKLKNLLSNNVYRVLLWLTALLTDGHNNAGVSMSEDAPFAVTFPPHS